jgi:hypothetical protein
VSVVDHAAKRVQRLERAVVGSRTPPDAALSPKGRPPTTLTHSDQSSVCACRRISRGDSDLIASIAAGADPHCRWLIEHCSLCGERRAVACGLAVATGHEWPPPVPAAGLVSYRLSRQGRSVPVQAPGERRGDLLPMRGADPARPRRRAQAHDADRTGRMGIPVRLVRETFDRSRCDGLRRPGSRMRLWSSDRRDRRRFRSLQERVLGPLPRSRYTSLRLLWWNSWRRAVLIGRVYVSAAILFAFVVRLRFPMRWQWFGSLQRSECRPAHARRIRSTPTNPPRTSPNPHGQQNQKLQ